MCVVRGILTIISLQSRNKKGNERHGFLFCHPLQPVSYYGRTFVMLGSLRNLHNILSQASAVISSRHPPCGLAWRRVFTFSFRSVWKRKFKNEFLITFYILINDGNNTNTNHHTTHAMELREKHLNTLHCMAIKCNVMQ